MTVKFGEDYVIVDKRDLEYHSEAWDELDERACEFLGIERSDNAGRHSPRYIIRKVDFMGRDALIILRQDQWQGRPQNQGDVKVMISTPGMQWAGTGFFLYNSPRESEAWNEALAQARAEGRTDDSDYMESLVKAKASIQFDAWWREMEGLLLSM